MPAAVAKGIILSISIITALGLAVYENPQVQAWFEEQRKALVELLRSIGGELDPETRRQAEAIAFEGRSPANDANTPREAAASRDAAAVATGRSMSNSSTVRRIPVQGPSDPLAAEERKRQGREYLAKRNQQMYELQERRKAAKEGEVSTPPTPTSFDALVDDHGNLKTPTQEAAASALESLPQIVMEEMREVGKVLQQPLVSSGTDSSSGGWQAGSILANPFGDEYALDRSETPKPPVPPKIQLDNPSIPSVPSTVLESLRSISPRPTVQSDRSHSPINTEGLTYDEQLAIALSLSDQDSLNSATLRRRESQREERQFQEAVRASLKEFDHQQAAHAIAHPQPLTPQLQPRPEPSAPLVDLTPDPPVSLPSQAPRDVNPWQALFTQSPSSRQLADMDPPTSVPKQDYEDDELYRVTPELTRARLATLDQQNLPLPSVPSGSETRPNASYDPVHEAAESHHQQAPPEASFYSAVSSAPSIASTHTISNESEPPQLIDIADVNRSNGLQIPDTVASHAASNTETFVSVSAPRSTQSQASDIEVVDVEHDSDDIDDIMSEEGIATPDSWTEVGSRDGDSEMSELDEFRPQPAI